LCKIAFTPAASAERNASGTSGRLRTPKGVKSNGHRSAGSVALKITRTNFVATYIAKKRLSPRAR